ncbi:RmlC-like cupin domain-containing protein [Lactarius akahatsu]|uniref:RmlC-like cupin domain-containing protein n=1 Tax=Lactarius akahatsu TaxID=416441 RepID=A0AAD4QC78_9AGAM|nr:RmlC-like cupin domain-containing protein [Lactarius akahatsu]
MDYSSSPRTAELIKDLGLIPHPEGGFFVETDRQDVQTPSPYADGALRSLSTTIFYLLTADNPSGKIHMNKSITMHVHHTGRAEYTLITPSPEKGGLPAIKRVVMGPNASAGEQRQLLVGTGVWKMSRLLDVDLKGPDLERTGCLITEVVIPGFHWEDHKYLTQTELEEMFAANRERVLEFLVHVKGE